MTRKRYKPEEIVAKLRQVDVLVSQGQNMVDAIRHQGLGRQAGGLRRKVGSARPARARDFLPCSWAGRDST